MEVYLRAEYVFWRVLQQMNCIFECSHFELQMEILNERNPCFECEHLPFQQEIIPNAENRFKIEDIREEIQKPVH